MLILTLTLTGKATGSPYPNEDALADASTGRDTFIFDPGEGERISQSQLAGPLASYYVGKGFDRNFLEWASVKKINPDGLSWAFCTPGSQSNPCQDVAGFFPVRALVTGGDITVLEHDGAFIGLVCGNYRGTGVGPIPKIAGVKYEDEDGDGARDPGEPGLGGWTIRLRHGGSVVATTTTAANGSYSFRLDANQLPIGAGQYRVEEVQKPGWAASETPGPVSVPLGSGGTTFGGRDFGNYRPARISGVKFDDSNVDGLRGALEPLLAGWEIGLSDGQSDTTDANGEYGFSVRPGTYTVSETQQSGWRQTAPGAPGTRTFTVRSGDVVENADFGNVCLGQVDVLPVDESTGLPVTGLEVRLEEVDVPGILDNDPALPLTTTGTPSFGDLLPGTYRVTVFLPVDLFTTDPDLTTVDGRFAIVKEIVVAECEATEVPIDLVTESTEGAKVTGGFKVGVPGGFATGGYVFMNRPSGLHGMLQHTDHEAPLNLHAREIELLDVTGDTATVWGRVDVDGVSTRFSLRLVDAGEPPLQDRYELQLENGYTAGFGAPLEGGNVQIH